MRRASRAAALTLGLVTATFAASSPADAAPITAETSVDGTGNMVTDSAGNAIAVAADGYFAGQALFRYRRVNGGWSQQYEIPGLGRGLARVAPGRVNMPFAVGHVRGSEVGLAAVMRRTDATWSPPTRLAAAADGLVSSVDVAGNADGDFAVSWTQAPSDATSGTTYAAIRLRGDRWRTYVVGRLSYLTEGLGTRAVTSVGIDAYGNVTVARTVTDGTTERLLTRRKPAGGGWQAQQQVSAAGESVRWLDMVIEPTGRQTLAYQLETSTSTPYGESFVLRQATVGGALGQVWHQAASSKPSIAAAGGRLRVVWATVTGTDPARGFTQAFNPAAEPVQDLGGDPAGVNGVTIDRLGQGVVASGIDYAATAHPVTATTLGAGQVLNMQDQQVIDLQPALGAGSTYFVGVNSHFDLPAGYLEDLVVFRATRP